MLKNGVSGSDPPTAIPIDIPIGEAIVYKMKTNNVVHSFGLLPLVLNVEPTAQLTGILWIITPTASIANCSTLSKIPIAKPSITLCMIIAIPKLIRAWVFVL